MTAYRVYAKINWALSVTGKEGGYHMLDSVMQTVSLYDVMTLLPADSFSVRAHTADGASFPDSLCTAAGQAFFRAAKLPQRIHVRLEKHIPSEAGLGGGSSDCGNLLTILNEHYGYPLTREQLFALAANLGADVPFFLEGGCQRAKGKGERLTPLSIPPISSLLIVKPEGGVSTKEAFDRYDRLTSKKSCSMDDMESALRSGDLREIGKFMQNGLEAASIPLLPEIGRVKKQLFDLGALGAVMTGSGAAVVGLFEKIPQVLPFSSGMQAFACATVPYAKEKTLVK